jgi:hypothetical protein
VCADCARAKARQRNILKGNDTVHATKNAGRLYMDISSIKTTSFGGAKFWLLVVDKKTDYLWSFLSANLRPRIKSVSLCWNLTRNKVSMFFSFNV